MGDDAIFGFTPTRASWLNQVEIRFILDPREEVPARRVFHLGKATPEGDAILARAYDDIAPFDQATASLA